MFKIEGEMVVTWGSKVLQERLNVVAKKAVVALGAAILATILMCSVIFGAGIGSLVVSIILISIVFGFAGYIGKDALVNLATKNAKDIGVVGQPVVLTNEVKDEAPASEVASEPADEVKAEAPAPEVASEPTVEVKAESGAEVTAEIEDPTPEANSDPGAEADIAIDNDYLNDEDDLVKAIEASTSK